MATSNSVLSSYVETPAISPSKSALSAAHPTPAAQPTPSVVQPTPSAHPTPGEAANANGDLNTVASVLDSYTNILPDVPETRTPQNEP